MNRQNTNQVATPGNVAYESTYGNYNVNPSIGFFIKKNSLIGLTIPVSYVTNKVVTSSSPTTTSNTNETWVVGLSPYFQHYWSSTRFTPFTRVNVGYANYSSGSSNGQYMNGGLAVGFAYMAGERFIIETSFADASIVYQLSDQSSSQTKTKTWDAGIKVGLAGNFAIRYVLRNR
ncbi:hypothetical protein GCM10028805_16440 [Spirosoma harenae]